MTNIQWTGSYPNSFILQPTKAEPIETPRGLIATRAVEVKQGWIGQVIVDRVILWESAPYEGEHGEKNALREANDRVVSRLRKMLA